MHILSGKSECIDRSTRRERDVCVLFEFRQFFNSRELVYVFQSFMYILAKNLIDEMSLSDCITL